MIRIIASIVLLALAVTACNKDKFQTKPTLSLKSMNGNVVPSGASLALEFEFTDKEGDVNDTLFVKKIRLNKIKVPTVRDSFPLAVPNFPENNQGTLKVVLDHSFYLTSAINPPKDPVTGKNMNDTLILKFVLKDRANNVSDTVTTEQIVVLR
ncbi:MAG TPA: hypothetical protein VGD17_15335 [Chitinophagaceae bacterium]